MKIAAIAFILFSFCLGVRDCFAGDKKASSKTIVVGMDAEPRTIDSRFAVDANSQYLENLINCSLVTFDSEGEVIGDLADNWKWVNEKTLSVNIKKGFKFSSGTPLSLDDVKSTYDFFSNPSNKSPRSGAFRNIKLVSIDKKKNALVFALNKPDASFVTNLVVGILPQAKASGKQIKKANEHIGCGPFKLDSYSMSTIKLSSNPQHPEKSKTGSKNIEIKIVKSESTRFAKLRKGEIDLVQNTLNRESVKKVGSKYKNLKVSKKPGLRTTYLGFNMKDKIAGDYHVRRAISLAIDRKKIIKYIFAGMATPASTILTPNNSFFLKSLKPHEQSLDEAKKILDDAGYQDPDGDGPKPRITLSYKTTTNASRINVAKAIASQLRKIGINLKVQPLEWGKFKSDVEAGRVQVWSLTWIGFKDPDIYRFAFGGKNVPPNGPNRGWYQNEKLDTLLEEASQATDTKRRKVLYHRIQEIVEGDLPYVFLWHEEVFAVMNKNLKGFKLFADGRLSSLTQTSK